MRNGIMKRGGVSGMGMALAGLVALGGAAMGATAFSGAAWAADFETRATGRTFQCGAQVVEIPRGGPPTLSVRDTPEIRTATKVKWFPHRVKLTFGRGTAPLKLSEFGATVTLVAAGRSTVCVGQR